MKKSTAILLAAAGAVLWGAYGTFTSLLRELGLSAASVAMIGPFFILVVFTVLTLKQGWRNYRMPLKIVPAVILYGLSCALDSYTAVKAYALLPLAVGSIIIYCNLFLLLIFSRLLFKEKLSKEKLIAALIAVAGIACVVNVFDVSGAISPLGLLFTFCAMVCWAAIVLLEKYLLNAGLGGNTILSLHGLVAFSFLALLHSPASLVQELAAAFVLHPLALPLTLLTFGILIEVTSYQFYITALKGLSPALVQMAFTLDPVTACILGFAVFGQTLSLIQLFGIALILAVVAWLHWQSRREEESKEEETVASG